MERLGPAPGRLGRAAQTARRLTYHSDSRADRRKTAGLSRPAPLSLRGCRSVPPKVVCAKFSKSVMGGGLAERRSKLPSLCSIGQTHPFVPTCPPAERRAQPRSRLAAGHRWRRRAAVWTAASTVLG